MPRSTLHRSHIDSELTKLVLKLALLATYVSLNNTWLLNPDIVGLVEIVVSQPGWGVCLSSNPAIAEIRV